MHRCCLTLILGTFASFAVADDDIYVSEIRPLLRERCFACHGALKQEAGLRLDTGERIRAGGDSGNAVTLNDPSESLLIERLTSVDEDERMPPEGQALTAAQIAAFENWIADGANSPDDEQPQPDPAQHWSFQPLSRPSIPGGSDDCDAGNPIDFFINRKLKQNAIQAQKSATKSVQLRRLYLDLIGVPPTRDERQDFLSDDASDAWTRVVARLLDDPRHAERWARHWMDVWRYSDWYGRRNVPDVWNSAPQVWRWRDWIVKSINEDKGYDRMVTEMLAADEALPGNADASYATGFLVRNWYALNPNDWMRANVEHTGKAFLGLTFNCAHCHDHKYDPISHEDYFRMRAFFEPLYIRQDRVAGEPDPGPFQDYDYSTLRKVQHLGSVQVFDKTPEAATWFYSGGDERNREQDRGTIRPGIPEFLDDGSLKIQPIQLPPSAWYPGFRADLQATILDDAKRAISDAQANLTTVQQTKINVPQMARDQLAAAQSDYEASVAKANQNGRLTAIAGEQSLVFDATGGRRVLQNRVRQLKEFSDGYVIEFQLQLTTDAHFNFQLAKHIDKGHTASLVAFKTGSLVAYLPGTVNEFQVGKYDFSAGQSRFSVRLVLQPSADQCQLSIRSTSDDTVLVDNASVALNGWNPKEDPNTGIFLDAQTGSIVAVDDLKFASSPADIDGGLHFDFEPPTYLVGQDIVGHDGWETSSFGSPPATSIVSHVLHDVSVAKAEQELASARRTVRIPELRLAVAKASLVAAQSDLESIEARIAADEAKYGSSTDEPVSSLSQRATQLERNASFAKLEADLRRAEHAVAVVGSKPLSDDKRAKELESSTKTLVASKVALEKWKSTPFDQQSEAYTPLSPVYPTTSTGRRLALANWITNGENPLTARVAVNHVWTRHFHAPLVETVYDFGINGSDPTHPDLLDWLAIEFIESGWSLKHIHRLIVTSDAYRRSSKASIADFAGVKIHGAHQQDPENKLLWRMNMGRMEGEVIRDSLLHCADLLDLMIGGQPLENANAMTTHRRSLYYEVYPEDGGASELSDLFDAPSPLECYRRTRSIVPQQALALTNSDLIHRVCTAIVKRWAISNDGPVNHALQTKFVKEMFEQILTRTPTGNELQICLDGLNEQHDLHASETPDQALEKSRQSLVRVLLNHNDFVTVR